MYKWLIVEKKYLYPWDVPYSEHRMSYPIYHYSLTVSIKRLFLSGIGVDVIDLRMNHCSIMINHSRRHRPSYLKTAVLPLGRTGRTTASRPVPSGALGSPPAGPRWAPGRLRTLSESLEYCRMSTGDGGCFVGFGPIVYSESQ